MRAPGTAAAIAAIALAAACGGEERRAAPPPPVVVPSTATAQPAGGDDVIVAKVNDQPVYGSCVKTQAEALGLDARAALDQCIAFELLAQEADRRGLREDPDVADAWRREMVRRVIAADLGGYQTLEELPAGFRDAMLAKFGQYLQRPLLRGAHYARVDVARGAIKGGPEDLRARAVADAIYAELKDQEGILPDELFAVADRHAAAAGLAITRTHKPYFTPEREVPGIRGAQPEFLASLMQATEVGRIGPPARTRQGWDIPLYWTFMPAKDLTPEFFVNARQQYFQQWAEGIRARLGLEVSIEGEALARLAEEDTGTAAGATGGEPDTEAPP
jgi:hypothetical protein